MTPEVDFLGKQSVTRLSIFRGFVREANAVDLRQFNSGLEHFDHFCVSVYSFDSMNQGDAAMNQSALQFVVGRCPV